MATIFDRQSFMEETGRVMGWRQVERLGLTPQDLCGTFSPNELPALREFCRLNPDFHIISFIAPLVAVNREDSRGDLFMIGNGNADPDLSYVGNYGYTADLAKWTPLKVR